MGGSVGKGKRRRRFEKPGGGAAASALDGLEMLPTCICKPNLLNCACITDEPISSSLRDEKENVPSSTYSRQKSSRIFPSEKERLG